MRDPSAAELLLLARALLPVPAKARLAAAIRILQEVEAADQHLRLWNRCHPNFGDGGLMSRCLALSPPAEPMANNPDFLSAIIIASQAFLHHFKA